MDRCDPSVKKLEAVIKNDIVNFIYDRLENYTSWTYARNNQDYFNIGYESAMEEIIAFLEKE